MTRRFNKTEQRATLKRKRKWCKEKLPFFIAKERWPPNSPDLNPLDYSIWTELVQAINWVKVVSKSTTVKQLQLAVKKIRQDVVLDRCDVWYSRVRSLTKTNGDYIP